ncbi:MAG: dolichyl-diphosphooligosaccharide--protein glycosyltransferase subunit STT3 [Deferribacteraceae bacterium]|jgi:dolichyl-diphosphooligosaccharide--protein glycosyltransferase|nr:dolichyl-diphosphooligosaccharide--protein glycosyltransferase subunit STT3 [Deferribacteraceae bacterium]
MPHPLYSFIAFLVCVVGVYAAITASRYFQLVKGWDEYRAAYYLDDVPMVTTVDAFRWIHYADDLLEDRYDVSQKDPLMYYPDGSERMKPFPLLSLLLILISGLKDVNLFEAGIRLIPFLAGLFVFPLAFFFYRLGYPAAGLLGGITGGFSAVYFNRSTAGRIDTDSLNLFFLFLTPLLILLTAEKRDRRVIFALSAATGISQLLLQLWYHHAMFIIIFFFIFAFSLFLYKHDLKTISISSGIYLLFAGPQYVYGGITHLLDLIVFYLFTPKEQLGGYPNVYYTVTEAGKLGVGELLGDMFVHPVVAVFAFALLALMAHRLNKKLFPLLPIFLIGIMAFISSSRFVMFLAPFMGVAYGFLINTLLRLIPAENRALSIIKEAACYPIFAIIALLLLLPANVRGVRAFYIPPPSISPSLYSSFNILRDYLPKDSAIYTWWDFGLAIEAQAQLATFHDGLSQNTPKTWLIARSYLLSQADMSKHIAYIANNGVKELKKISLKQGEALIDAYDAPLEKENVYLFFTEDMIGKFSAIHYIGSWDNSSLEDFFIQPIRCADISDVEINCEAARIRTDLGLMYRAGSSSAAAYPIKVVAELEGGVLQSERNTDFPQGWFIVVSKTSGKTRFAFIMNKQAYESSFVQLFILGKPDSERFEEVVNLFPLMRLFKVKSYGVFKKD